MGDVNAVACSWPCGDSGCAANASLDGVPAPGTPPLTDKLILDDALPKLAETAAAFLERGTPFYLAVGFRKPHLPFRYPYGYADQYPPPANVSTARFPVLDDSVPPIAYHQSSLWDDPYTAMPRAQAEVLRRDYYAAVSWVDHQVGVLLAALETSGVSNDTAVVFHSDHGYSLGEHGEWEKFTEFEHGTRVPLIIRAPWRQIWAGLRVTALASLVDVYPTLADLAGE
jgi:iduronate 2-sulfatase